MKAFLVLLKITSAMFEIETKIILIIPYFYFINL